MTPSAKQNAEISREKYNLIADLILGWWSSIINAPEIQKLYPFKERKKFNKRRKEIIKCASIKFIDNHDGYKLLKRGARADIHKYIITSVLNCI